MKPRREKQPETGAPPEGVARSKDRRMVPLDQEPLRRRMASECSREMARLEMGRVKWKRFEQEDKPAFSRWMAATFGTLLSQVRENESLIRAQKSLIHEVEIELQSGRARSHRTAYAAVLQRRANPPLRSSPPPQEEKADPYADLRFKNIPESEQRQYFHEFVETVLGLDPEAMSEPRYQKMFADFQADVFGMGGPARAAAPVEPARDRVKELYRLLVRRLHPDTRADASVEVSSIWHEVQEAYGDGNIERLEMLVAVTDIQSDSIGEQTTVSQMKAVIANLRASIDALRRSLRAARRDPSWNFTRAADRSALRARLQRELERALSDQKKQLRTMEVTISRWSVPPKQKRSKAQASG
ncbi:MAG: hypothetical protein JWL59_3498 [Chthoniobacteraceae bacterium]|nr:hypothetical protein [Chthoniobacteraceae bacterium]